jgi:hypothetical protein
MKSRILRCFKTIEAFRLNVIVTHRLTRAAPTRDPICRHRNAGEGPTHAAYELGVIPRYGNANAMICPKAGAATVPP